MTIQSVSSAIYYPQWQAYNQNLIDVKKKLENLTHDDNDNNNNTKMSIKTKPKITQMLELADQSFKPTIINTSKAKEKRWL